MIIDNAQHYSGKVIALLAAEKLPTADLPESLDNFLVAIADRNVIGVAGIEIYGSCGLLRSVAVSPNYRGSDIAGKLISHVEALARSKGLTSMYLLTETAPEYFRKKDYIQIHRENAPTEIKSSSEFSSICPISAIVMYKPLTDTK